jgi:hypothetical protein
MVAVQSFRDVFIEVPLTPGIVYLCKRHYYNPILNPKNEREEAASVTEGEKGTELRPCDFTGHMALTAECARLRREVATKDDRIQRLIAEGDRLASDLTRLEGVIERLWMRLQGASNVAPKDSNVAPKDAGPVLWGCGPGCDECAEDAIEEQP